jgi:hypothetical protein
MEGVQKEMADAISKATQDHELRMRQLQDQVDSMERQNGEIMDKNHEDEVKMRKERGRSEINLNSKIKLYDEDMFQRQKTWDQLVADFQAEYDEFTALKEHFDKVDADIRRGTEEEQILKAVARRRAYGQWVMDVYATRMQNIVRGHKARAEVAKIKSKMKKGKKGKKK